MTSPSTVALRFSGVHKRYGRANALDGLSFEIPRGCIAGFVGHNGAGKTTSFSIVSGYLTPDEGEVDILGLGAFQPEVFKGRLGVLPQDASLPERHTPRELLVHLCALQGLALGDAQAETDRVLQVVSLGDRADRRIGSLSHGMRRRVAAASALCGSPELVLLDEPLAGLDPVQAYALRDALADLRGIQTLVVSSHNLSEIERLCDWVVMLKDGRCLRQGAIADVTGQTERVTWQLGPGPVPLEQLRQALPEHRFTLRDGALEQHAPADGDLDGSSIIVMKTLAEAEVGIRGVTRGMALEQTFIADAAGR